MPFSYTKRLLLPALLAAGVGTAHAQAVRWLATSAGTKLPANAVSSGAPNNVTICRIFQNGDYYPGEIGADGSCVSASGGAEVKSTTFEVLIGPRSLDWSRTSGATPPAGAVAAGKSGGQALYVCRTNGHIGRLVGGTCSVYADGRVINATEFDVLAMGALRSSAPVAKDVPPGRPSAARAPAGPTSTPFPPGSPTPPASTPFPPGSPTPPVSTPFPPGSPTPPASTPFPPGTPAPPASTPIPPGTPVPPASTPGAPSTPTPPAPPATPTSSR